MLTERRFIGKVIDVDVCVSFEHNRYFLCIIVNCTVSLCLCSGNDYLHDLTSQAKFTLRIDMEDFKNVKKYAVYSDFAVASESKKYRLSFDTYSGNAGDCVTLVY